MLTIAHVTHEAVQKIGGIGAVLDGLITARPYREAVGRTILVGPLFSRRGAAADRLGPGGTVLFSSIDGIGGDGAAAGLRDVCGRFGVDIVYGRKPVTAPESGEKVEVEALLVDVHSVQQAALGLVKFRLFEAYGVASDRFEHVWDFEQYVRLAGPAVEGLKALGVTSSCAVVAHEFMGMPTALLAMADKEADFRGVFHAHEAATVRRIVEDHPGQDVTFYNLMRRGRRAGKTVTDYFGDQSGYFKHALVEAAKHCHAVLAVGPEVVEELKFLSRDFERVDVRLAYNGIPSRAISAAEAARSKRRLQQYCETLLGWSPDYVFTHVTRLVRSKGLWRDLMVMEHVDSALRREGKSAVLLVLATETGGPRSHEEILHQERGWRWPVAHREGYPDLTHGEAAFYAGVQEFNARARNCRAVFINQFGFDRATCGERMPEDMEFWDIRRGSDAEFGQSVYEPFGIAQLEALSFGAICVISSVCGCAGFVAAAAGGASPNVIVPDYTKVEPEDVGDQALLSMTAVQRERIERLVAERTAATLMERLPRTPREKELAVRRGGELAGKMSWEVVARDYFLPGIEAALRHGMIVKRV